MDVVSFRGIVSRLSAPCVAGLLLLAGANTLVVAQGEAPRDDSCKDEQKCEVRLNDGCVQRIILECVRSKEQYSQLAFHFNQDNPNNKKWDYNLDSAHIEAFNKYWGVCQAHLFEPAHYVNRLLVQCGKPTAEELRHREIKQRAAEEERMRQYLQELCKAFSANCPLPPTPKLPAVAVPGSAK